MGAILLPSAIINKNAEVRFGIGMAATSFIGAAIGSLTNRPSVWGPAGLLAGPVAGIVVAIYVVIRAIFVTH